MKIYKLGFLAFFVLFLFSSCEKETEGLSKISYHAVFEMAGDEFLFVIRNSTFTDPGVKAFENGQALQVKTTGKVNTSVPGIYQLTYSATNSDGLSRSINRTVAIVNAVPSVDLAGNYSLVHATRTGTITITKNDGVVGYYHGSDCWWQSSRIQTDFVDMGDGTLLVLDGRSNYGPHRGTGAILAGNQIRFDMTIYDGGNKGTAWTTTYQKQ